MSTIENEMDVRLAKVEEQVEKNTRKLDKLDEVEVSLQFQNSILNQVDLKELKRNNDELTKKKKNWSPNSDTKNAVAENTIYSFTVYQNYLRKI